MSVVSLEFDKRYTAGYGQRTSERQLARRLACVYKLALRIESVEADELSDDCLTTTLGPFGSSAV